MSVAMEQHQNWLEARKRLDGGNNQVRTSKVVTLKTVVKGKTAQVVRISPDVPLPKAAAVPRRPKAGDRPKAIPDRQLDRVLRILHSVGLKHGVSVAAMRSQQRFEDVSKARAEACYLLLTEAALSSPQAARMLGGKHHTSILYAAKTFAKREGRSMP